MSRSEGKQQVREGQRRDWMELARTVGKVTPKKISLHRPFSPEFKVAPQVEEQDPELAPLHIIIARLPLALPMLLRGL